jgi:hypothetical protein
MCPTKLYVMQTNDTKILRKNAPNVVRKQSTHILPGISYADLIKFAHGPSVYKLFEQILFKKYYFFLSKLCKDIAYGRGCCILSRDIS